MSVIRGTIGSALACLLLAACGHTGYRRVLVMSDGDASVAVAARGGVYAETVAPGVSGVAVYRRGRLGGVAELRASGRELDWLDRSHELVDHPRLAEWQARLDDLDALIDAAQAPAESVLPLLERLPFRALLSDKILAWMGEDPARAAAILDRASELDLRRAVVRQAATRAVVAPGLDDGRLSLWAGVEEVRESREASLAVAGCPEAGERTLRTLLQGIDELPYQARAEVFSVIGARLASRPGGAYLLVKQMDELPYDARALAALELLARDDASDELALEVLRNLDEFRYQRRAGLLRAAAERVGRLSRGRRLLVARLEEVPGGERARVALDLMAMPQCAGKIETDLLEELDTFRSSDQERIIGAVIDGPAYVGAVQGACIRAGQRGLSSRSLRRIMRRIAEDARTEEGWRRSARNLLEN